MYLLDTNIVSYWMRGERSLMDKIRSYSPSDLSLSTITLAEILYGIEKSPIKKKERRTKIDRICSQLELHPFDEPAAEKYALIRSRLERDGLIISGRDLQIASISMANRLCIVTHNTKEFNRIKDLTVEDWAQVQ
jgi:tRNA(fMet)-specific endonuclease VapC